MLVDGIYDQVTPPNEREWQLALEYANLDPERLQDLYGLTLPLLTKDTESLVKTVFVQMLSNVSKGFFWIQARYQANFHLRSCF